MKLVIRNYLRFKFLNSLFAGSAMGTVFVIYSLLEPAIFSLGGIVLAILTLLVAKIYSRIMKIEIFFLVTVLVEIAMLVAIVAYLASDHTRNLSLFIYLCYQVMFLFGGYIVRFETLALGKIKLLSYLDVRKQAGYLAGLFVSFIAYKALDQLLISNSSDQVWYLHWALLIIQLVVISLAFKSFKRSAS